MTRAAPQTCQSAPRRPPQSALQRPHGEWLRPLPDNWPAIIHRALVEESAQAVVRIVVAEVSGSAPREPGACMVVTGSHVYGTIGGGNLEWTAVRSARALLDGGGAVPGVVLHRFVLAKELAQCCGGVVHLWLERFTASDVPLLASAAAAVSLGRAVHIATELSDGAVSRRVTPATCSQAGSPSPRSVFSHSEENTALLLERVESAAPPLWLFGAGHVGQALVRVLAELPFATTWIDTRPDLMPAAVPENVQPLLTDDPVRTLATAPQNARFLVMTHDHALDYDLCRAILRDGHFEWLGLIGSRSKGARFRSRLAREGIAPERLTRLVCPVGITGIDSKSPAAIAIAIAAQLLQQATWGPGTDSLDTGTANLGTRLGTEADLHTGSCSDCASCRASKGSHA